MKNTDKINYFNYALHKKPQNLDYYITDGHGKSSIYKPNFKFLSQFEDVERYKVNSVQTLSSKKIRTLDSFIKDRFIIDIDFIKLDTQGSELDILKGCQNYAIHNTFGMQIEVEFIEIYENQSLFRDVDAFMQKNGFQLFDIRRQYWKRKEFYEYVGKGQLIFGDALYFKKLDVLFKELSKIEDQSYIISKIYKSILVCSIYGIYDYAVSIAKKGLELNYLSKNEFESVIYHIKNHVNEIKIPNFPGRWKLSIIADKIYQILKPKNLLWADSDNEIGNITDK